MKTKGAEFIWFDGKLVKWEEATIPVMSHALHYGTSVFEGIRAYPAKNNLYIFRLKEHMERLHRSARVYSLCYKLFCKGTMRCYNRLTEKDQY